VEVHKESIQINVLIFQTNTAILTYWTSLCHRLKGYIGY